MALFCLTIARLCSAMWVGAALLFVVTSVTEQVEPAFETVTRDRLALIRFPWYYGAGFLLLTGAAIASVTISRRRRAVFIAAMLLFLALGVMGADYVCVFRPLRAALTPPGAARPAEFHNLHQWSERLNAAGLLLSFAAAVLLCASGERKSRRGELRPEAE